MTIWTIQCDYGNLNDSGRTISTKYYSHPTQCITKSKFENCHLKTTESEKQNTGVLCFRSWHHFLRIFYFISLLFLRSKRCQIWIGRELRGRARAVCSTNWILYAQTKGLATFEARTVKVQTIWRLVLGSKFKFEQLF